MIKLVKARCMKCKVSVEVIHPTVVKLKTGARAIRGKCSKCGTAVFRMTGGGRG